MVESWDEPPKAFLNEYHQSTLQPSLLQDVPPNDMEESDLRSELSEPLAT
jgi:hypothetical protein